MKTELVNESTAVGKGVSVEVVYKQASIPPRWVRLVADGAMDPQAKSSAHRLIIRRCDRFTIAVKTDMRLRNPLRTLRSILTKSKGDARSWPDGCAGRLQEHVELGGVRPDSASLETGNSRGGPGVISDAGRQELSSRAGC